MLSKSIFIYIKKNRLLEILGLQEATESSHLLVPQQFRIFLTFCISVAHS